MKKPETIKPEEKPSVPIYREEIMLLKDVAHIVSHLGALAHEDTDITVGNIEFLIKKICDPSWELAMSTLDERWKEAYPNDRLPQFWEERDFIG